MRMNNIRSQSRLMPPPGHGDLMTISDKKYAARKYRLSDDHWEAGLFNEQIHSHLIASFSKLQLWGMNFSLRIFI